MNTGAACEGHGIGHMCSMVPELRTDTCEEIADTAVGLAFCQAQGGPDNSVLELCMSVGRDAAAVTAGCAAIGISEFSFLECSNFGYDYTTCSQVAALTVGGIPLLIDADMAAAQGLPDTYIGAAWFTPFPQTLADGSDGCAAFVADGGVTVCPMLVAVNSAANGGTRADNCDDWSRSDGHNLGWGQSAVADLAPTMAAGVTFQDYCGAAPAVARVDPTDTTAGFAAGSPAAATSAICNAVPADSALAACNAFQT